MFKPIVRMAAAVFVAGVIALAITAAPAARAVNATAKPALSQPIGKADRLRVPARDVACTQHNWPNFEAKCLFDARQDDGEARTVRVIALR